MTDDDMMATAQASKLAAQHGLKLTFDMPMGRTLIVEKASGVCVLVLQTTDGEEVLAAITDLIAGGYTAPTTSKQLHPKMLSFAKMYSAGPKTLSKLKLDYADIDFGTTEEVPSGKDELKAEKAALPGIESQTLENILKASDKGLPVFPELSLGWQHGGPLKPKHMGLDLAATEQSGTNSGKEIISQNSIDALALIAKEMQAQFKPYTKEDGAMPTPFEPTAQMNLGPEGAAMPVPLMQAVKLGAHVHGSNANGDYVWRALGANGVRLATRWEHNNLTLRVEGTVPLGEIGSRVEVCGLLTKKNTHWSNTFTCDGDIQAEMIYWAMLGVIRAEKHIPLFPD